MRKDISKTIKIIDYIKLIIASVALIIIIGGFIYKYKELTYQIDVNIVISFMLGFYVMLTGLEIFLREKYKNIGMFLMLCSIIILSLNIIAISYK